MGQGYVRKQVYLTAEQNERLRKAAARERRSEAELLREALDRMLPGHASFVSDEDPLWGIVGIGEGGHDLSVRVDEVLYGRSSR